MKVGTRPKKFFADIVVLPRSEVKKFELEIEKHKNRRIPERRPPVFDAVMPEGRIEKGVEKLWQKEEPNLILEKKSVARKFYHLWSSIPPRAGIQVSPKRAAASGRDVELSEASGRRYHLSRGGVVVHSLEEVAERALRGKTEAQARTSLRLKPKKLFKKSLIFALQFSIVAVMVYHAVSLYFEKDWLSEKLNNLAIASKARIALAESSIANFDRDGSSREIEKAGISLLQIKSELLSQGEYNYILPDHPLLDNQLSTGQSLLELGLLIKDTNNDVNSILDNLTGENDEGQDLSQRAKGLKPVVSRIQKRIARADTIVRNNDEVKRALGKEMGTKVENIIDRSKTEVKKIDSVLEVMPAILGANGNNRYLVLFLNNAEMRPGGGFPGNYGLINFENNYFKELYISDIYYLNRLHQDRVGVIKEKIETGEDPLSLVGLPPELLLSPAMDKLSRKGYWVMFSSNWSFDFENNAKRAIFLNNNLYNQDKVSGVLAITPNVIEDILAVVGPIEMEGYNIVLDKDNFRGLIEFKVEFDNPFKKENKRNVNPKQILADFGPILMEKISKTDLSEKIKIFESILKNIREKQIVMYHEDTKVQELLRSFGASGGLQNHDGDFLGISTINLNGMKNGQMLDYKGKLRSVVSPLGFAMNELSLIITHNETNPRDLHLREDGYIEIIVPKGSRLREARIDGRDFVGQIEYFDEAGRNVFGFHYSLEPGEAKNVFLKYQAPLRGYSEKGYSLNIFKQVGAKPIELEGEVIFEDQKLNPLIFRETIDSDKTIKP